MQEKERSWVQKIIWFLVDLKAFTEKEQLYNAKWEMNMYHKLERIW